LNNQFKLLYYRKRKPSTFGASPRKIHGSGSLFLWQEPIRASYVWRIYVVTGSMISIINMTGLIISLNILSAYYKNGTRLVKLQGCRDAS
jgi:hypothetical protein